MFCEWTVRVTWARFLSLSQNVLSNCLSQDRSETVLRSLASSVFRLCLRQKIVLWIHVQVLLNTLTFIKYFSENSHVSIISYIQIMYFYIAKLLHCNWRIDPLSFVWYRTDNLIFLIVCDVTFHTLVTNPNCLKTWQFQVTGYTVLGLSNIELLRQRQKTKLS